LQIVVVRATHWRLVASRSTSRNQSELPEKLTKGDFAMSGPATVSRPDSSRAAELQAQIDQATKELATSTAADAQAWANGMNKQGWLDEKGKPLKFNSAQEWLSAMKGKADRMLRGENAPAWKLANGTPINYHNLMNFTVAATATSAKTDAIVVKLNILRADLASCDALDKLLAAGDIEGALMMLQSKRVSLMDEQIGAQMQIMNDRNNQIKTLNDQMLDLQKKDKNGNADKIQDLKNQIDQLNSSSQLDMIRMQNLVNKRNEAFDTLSNLLSKFTKTMDNIIGNMR
jgi:predicted O-linked N-acetylglucosamine transferase (SPINDLY family)